MFFFIQLSFVRGFPLLSLKGMPNKFLVYIIEYTSRVCNFDNDVDVVIRECCQDNSCMGGGGDS
jgi:hypothetical protein